jgi:nitrite reductase/ring-hydroxylating ferredoxin subunit
LAVKQEMHLESDFVEVAKASDIAFGQMKSVVVNGIDVLLANVDGRFYAIDDRCGHMNAMLSMGKLEGEIVTCPFHFAQFNVTTGKKTKEPTHESFNIENLPQEMKDFLIYAGKLVEPVKTYDMQTHEVKLEGDKIFVRL